MKLRRLASLLLAVAAAAALANAAPALAVPEIVDVGGQFTAVAERNEARVLNSTPSELLAVEDSPPEQVFFSFTSAAGEAGPGSIEAKVECVGSIDNPHYSNGAGGAIYKSDVSCTGTGVPSVTVRQRGLLSFAATDTSPLIPRAESDYPQEVAVNGKPKTFYIPASGNGGRGTGYWVATSTWQIIAPGLSNPASGQRVFKGTI